MKIVVWCFRILILMKIVFCEHGMPYFLLLQQLTVHTIFPQMFSFHIMLFRFHGSAGLSVCCGKWVHTQSVGKARQGKAITALKKYIKHTRYSFCVTWRVEFHGIRVLWAPDHKGLIVITATVCLVIHTSGLHHSLFITGFPLPTRSWYLPSINTQPTDGVATQIWTSLFMEWCSWNQSIMCHIQTTTTKILIPKTTMYMFRGLVTVHIKFKQCGDGVGIKNSDKELKLPSVFYVKKLLDLMHLTDL